MTKVDLEKALNTIRFLSADGVQKANSGHTGLPMGTAALAYTLFMRHMKYNPADPLGQTGIALFSRGHVPCRLQHALFDRLRCALWRTSNIPPMGFDYAGHPEWHNWR